LKAVRHARLPASLIMKPRHFLLVVSALAAALHGGALAVQAEAAPGTIESPATIQSLSARPMLASGPHPWNGHDWLDRFYAPHGYMRAWTRQQEEAALALLDQAGSEGLDPADYRVDELRDRMGDAHADPARLDVAFTAAMLHYLADLRLGRVPSDYHTSGPDDRIRQFDPVDILRGALAQGSLDAAVARAEPHVPLYDRVKELLARYRELAKQPQPHLPAPGGKVRPGETYKGAQKLYAQLVLLGDLSDESAPAAAGYDDTLATGVKRFQARNGLFDSGDLDATTVAALNVPLAEHVHELELTLERLRWLPDYPSGPVVAVNVPTYRLWAFDRSQPAEAPLEMRVIVGQAVKTPTPLFIGQMRFLEFHPYWNVPRSITLKEIIPKLERSHGYLAREQMELVGQGGVSTAVNDSTIEALRAGSLRVRQRPGPKNSLGAVKFSMPNPMDIYLHATPMRELFRRSRRDLSHGCIRVEQPAELAQFVLRDQPAWDLDKIHAAMAPGPQRRVDLSAPIPVVIFYATALADRDGKALFGRDIYHRDPLLERALREHEARPSNE
jgi:murein L,D-transpeptidase YcbB/YkuD